jgi:hypothetical protein
MWFGREGDIYECLKTKHYELLIILLMRIVYNMIWIHFSSGLLNTRV